jgi:hypothetical protein
MLLLIFELANFCVTRRSLLEGLFDLLSQVSDLMVKGSFCDHLQSQTAMIP